MKSPFYAHLVRDSAYRAIFPAGLVPVRGMGTFMAYLEGVGPQECFRVAWEHLNIEERKAVAALVTAGKGTPEEFLSYMAAGGDLPLRVSQTSGVSGDSRFFT